MELPELCIKCNSAWSVSWNLSTINWECSLLMFSCLIAIWSSSTVSGLLNSSKRSYLRANKIISMNPVIALLTFLAGTYPTRCRGGTYLALTTSHQTKANVVQSHHIRFCLVACGKCKISSIIMRQFLSLYYCSDMHNKIEKASWEEAKVFR